jgi:hypothetical protein
VQHHEAAMNRQYDKNNRLIRHYIANHNYCRYVTARQRVIFFVSQYQSVYVSKPTLFVPLKAALGVLGHLLSQVSRLSTTLGFAGADIVVPGWVNIHVTLAIL